jgi:hypothetical protein
MAGRLHRPLALALHDWLAVRIPAWRAVRSPALALLERERRLAALWSHLAGLIARALYSRQRQYITLKRLDPAGAPPTSPDPETECLMVDSVEALDAVASEIPASLRDSVGELRRRIGAGCVVCLARRRRPDGLRHVVGYEVSERGVFSALGRRIPVPPDVIFSHHAEVLPAYRGRRIHGLMFAARDAYVRQRGGRVIVGVCRPDNHASLQALRRDGATIVGAVERLSVFRIVTLSWWSGRCPEAHARGAPVLASPGHD